MFYGCNSGEFRFVAGVSSLTSYIVPIQTASCRRTSHDAGMCDPASNLSEDSLPHCCHFIVRHRTFEVAKGRQLDDTLAVYPGIPSRPKGLPDLMANL